MSRRSKQEMLVEAREMVRMRLSGMSAADIAHEWGYSTPQAINRKLNAYLESLPTEQPEQLRELYSQRYESWLQRLAPRIEQGDVPAITAACKVADSLRRLHGLDESKTTMTVEHVTPEDIELRQLVSRNNQMKSEAQKIVRESRAET